MAKGALRVISEGELQQRDREQAEQLERDSADERMVTDSLAGHVRKTFDEFRRHRNSEQITQRLLDSLRAFQGAYSPAKLADIKKFGGSEVFARLTSVKCRGATAMLRDIYVSSGRPWGVDPTPVPSLPEPIAEAINVVLQTEVQNLQSQGVVVMPAQMEQRRAQLMEAATQTALRTAKHEARKIEKELDDILTEGGFYGALVEFLIDLPIFPYAIIKGPVVQTVTDLKWVEGKMVAIKAPKMHWYRVSPFDLYFSPGASNQEDTDIIERTRLRRSDLNALIGVKGYNEEAIRAVLREYPDGHSEQIEEGDSERAALESREQPISDHGWYDSLEFHGSVLGQQLLDYGMTDEEIPDPELDYHVTTWLVGRHVIKVQLNPNPRKRHPYYITSYEKVPGSLVGNAVPDLIADVQDVGNSALRSLVNNLSISSGPQVAINEDRLSPATNADTLYPWKRWRFISDPLQSNSEKPIDFFQPQSNAQELLSVYKAMSDLADEISAIPRYITGNEKVGGAARTASGLSMLMGNTAKVLQMVAANVDHDILSPLLRALHDMVMLTDTTGNFRGDESIVVKGVTLALQKDTDRMRRLEFLQIIGNPVDMEIIGPEGRAKILRHLSQDLGMPEDDIVPSDEELRQKQQMAQMQAMQMQAQAEMAGGMPPDQQAPKPGSAPQQGLGQETDNMFRTQGV